MLLVRKIVGEVELGGRAGLHADGGAVELLGRLHAERLLHHEALAVVVVDAGEGQAQRAVAASVQVVLRTRTSISPDCSAVKRSLAVVGDELDLGGIAEHGGGDRPAVVDVEARPVALVVGLREAGQADV